MKKKVAGCTGMKQHPDYGQQLSRLNRIGGQVDGIKKMIVERRYCPDILSQLRAVRAAVHAIEANILETHIDACVSDAFDAKDTTQRAQKISELKALYRKYND